MMLMGCHWMRQAAARGHSLAMLLLVAAISATAQEEPGHKGYYYLADSPEGDREGHDHYCGGRSVSLFITSYDFFVTATHKLRTPAGAHMVDFRVDGDMHVAQCVTIPRSPADTCVWLCAPERDNESRICQRMYAV